MTHDQIPVPLIASRADVLTEAPERYAKQLVSHLGRKIDFTTVGTTSTAAIGAATAQVVVGHGVLSLIATGADEEAVARVEQVLGGHLERFGQRGELTVDWTRGRRGVTEWGGRGRSEGATSHSLGDTTPLSFATCCRQ